MTKHFMVCRKYFTEVLQSNRGLEAIPISILFTVQFFRKIRAFFFFQDVINALYYLFLSLSRQWSIILL